MPLRFINGGNDLWAARFVLGSPSNQGDNHDPSCRCSSFFFFLLRKILFENVFRVVSVLQGWSLAMMDWWKADKLDPNYFRERKIEKFFFIDRVNSNLTIFLYKSVWQSVCSSWSLNIFFFHEEIGKSFPNVSRMHAARKRVWERLASNFSFGKIGGDPRQRELVRNRRLKYGKTGDFRVPERATSRAQLFLGMEIIGTNETWKNSTPFLRFFAPMSAQPPIRAISSAWEILSKFDRKIINQ